MTQPLTGRRVTVEAPHPLHVPSASDINVTSHPHGGPRQQCPQPPPRWPTTSMSPALPTFRPPATATVAHHIKVASDIKVACDIKAVSHRHGGPAHQCRGRHQCRGPGGCRRRRPGQGAAVVGGGAWIDLSFLVFTPPPQDRILSHTEAIGGE